MPNNSDLVRKHENWPHLDEKGNLVEADHWVLTEPLPFYVDTRPFWLKIWHLLLVVFWSKDIDKLEAPYMVLESERGKPKRSS